MKKHIMRFTVSVTENNYATVTHQVSSSVRTVETMGSVSIGGFNAFDMIESTFDIE